MHAHSLTFVLCRREVFYHVFKIAWTASLVYSSSPRYIAQNYINCVTEKTCCPLKANCIFILLLHFELNKEEKILSVFS